MGADPAQGKVQVRADELLHLSIPLLVLLATTAAAARLPDCIHVSTRTARPRWMPSLDAVRDCQEKAKEKLSADAAAKGKPLTPAALDKLDDEAREQARRYLAGSGAVVEGEPERGPRLGGVAKKDLGRVSAAEAEQLAGLEKRLHDAAGDGKEGITPAMGRDIIDSLTQKQGFVSAEMREVLDAVVRDGGKLTPETMKKLQGASRAAKGAGLDLNIDKGTEKNLLEHDFDSDSPAKPEPHADPGNL